MIVCVPSQSAATLIGPLPQGVQTVIWDGSGSPPSGVQFLVPPYVAEANALGHRADIREHIAGLPSLRVVQLLSAGVYGWSDLVPDGVVLCSARGTNGVATAELAVAGLLAVLRDLPQYVRSQDQRCWDRLSSESLDGLRVLVIGAGDIGSRIAAAVALFGAQVTSVARRPREGIRQLADLNGLLPTSDVVVLALPETPETIGLADKAFLAALPDRAVLVNVARGSIVATDALVTELTAGRLRAFLDVTDPEPLPPDHPLWTAPNVLITAHAGGSTRGWEQRAYRLVREQIERFAAGQPLENVVAAGY